MDCNGNSTAIDEEVAHPDVSIEIDFARLSIGISTRNSHAVPPDPPPRVSIHSNKGNTAFIFMRGQLGL